MAYTNLPIQLTSFIGRTGDLAEVERLLSEVRLVTLVGPGGCGKTRLAIQIAHRVTKVYENGIWWVDLASLSDPALVLQLIVHALGIRPVADQPMMELLISFVSPKQMLLVLDNCEHLIDACSQVVRRLLTNAPSLRILTTSREALAMVGETIYPVSGLAWPVSTGEVVQGGQSKLDLQALQGYDAVNLFVERVRAISNNFTITSENAFTILEICRRLDGLPLALELASARVNVLTVQEIAARLDDRFSFLTSGQRAGLEPRHHTLRATIDWSYDLLTAEERTFLRRLAVFTTGCTLDSAQAVCKGGGVVEGQILDLLSSLVDKSLVVAETSGRAQARYRLLETIREYALERLKEAGETSSMRDLHLDYFVSRTEEIAPKLTGPYQQLWFNWLETERDNLRAALAWALESGPAGVPEGDRIEAGLRIANALYQFWSVRNYWEEGLAWFERLLEQADDRIPVAVHAHACTYAAFLAEWRGNSPAAIKYGRLGVELGEAAGEEGKSILAFALGGLGSAMRVAGDYQALYAIGEQYIALFRELGNSYAYELGMGVLVQASTSMKLGKFDAAHALLDEGISLAREAGDSFRIAIGLNFRGDLARIERQYDQAQDFYEESAGMLRDLNDERDLAGTLQNLGQNCLHLGDIKRARSLFEESMALQQAQQNKDGIAECLIGFATLAVHQNLPAFSARLLAFVIASGWERRAWEWPATRMEYEQTIALVRTQLGEAAFEREQAAGRALSLEQAVEYARQLPIHTETAPRTIMGKLTERERQVAVLIAWGKTNREIAQELVLSKRTVEKHVANILSKLGLTSRGQIVRWTIEKGLVKASE